MSDISIPYHLAIPTVISAVGLLFILTNRKRLFKTDRWIWTCIGLTLTIYFLVVGTATYYDIYYQVDLNSYDLDKDGFFGTTEQTEAQKAAMNRLTSDTGRNFSMITGAIIAIMISGLTYVSGLLFQRIKSDRSTI